MTRIAGPAIAVALIVSGCAAPAEAPVARPAPPVAQAAPPAPPKFPALRNPGFELEAVRGARCAAGWNCTTHNDPDSFRFFVDVSEGRRSFCVEAVKREPWALVTQGSFERSLHGARLRFSVDLRLTGVVGAGAGPWAQVRRTDAPLQTHQKLVKGSTSWESQSVEFEVPENAQTVEVGVFLRGTGRACFDDARLEVLRPGKNPV